MHYLVTPRLRHWNLVSRTWTTCCHRAEIMVIPSPWPSVQWPMSLACWMTSEMRSSSTPWLFRRLNASTNSVTNHIAPFVKKVMHKITNWTTLNFGESTPIEKRRLCAYRRVYKNAFSENFITTLSLNTQELMKHYEPSNITFIGLGCSDGW